MSMQSNMHQGPHDTRLTYITEKKHGNHIAYTCFMALPLQHTFTLKNLVSYISS